MFAKLKIVGALDGDFLCDFDDLANDVEIVFLLFVRVIVDIVGRKQKVSCFRSWEKFCVFLTRHSRAAEGSVAPPPFWRRFGKGGKLRLIVERAR